jgi:hypothetical protein
VPLEVALDRMRNGGSDGDDEDRPNIYHDDLSEVDELFSDVDLYGDDDIPF